MRKLTIYFAFLCMFAAPAVATPSAPDRTAEHAPGPRTPASAGELDQYAQREKLAENLQKFEGGRGRGIEATTLVIILLIVILVLILV